MCSLIVLVWLMDTPETLQRVCDGAAKMGLEVRSVTLTCSRTNLISRWKNDRQCEWRTDEWLKASLDSLPFFSALKNTIDTDGLSIDETADRILDADMS